MNWELAGQIGTAVAGVVAVGGAVIGAWQALQSYRQSVRTRRAEWLTSLHEKFFEGDRYANIRRILDYKPEREYSELKAAVTTGSHHVLADELYRYLNFFEHLAILRDLGQISVEELSGLFDYDLRTLTQHQFVLDALGPQGFERLPTLIRSVSLPKKT